MIYSKNWGQLAMFILFIAILLSSYGNAQAVFVPSIPITGSSPITPAQITTLPPLDDFIAAISSSDTSGIRGIYIQDVMALRVVQQPLNDPGYVSGTEGVTTLFRQALLVNTIGLLAHNYAAGKYFSEIQNGDKLQVIYGNGEYKTYQVTAIYRFQALEPNSANSDFIDLQTNETLSTAQLFKKVYRGSHHVTLQTCIQQGEEPSWGRLFIIAEPI